MVVAILDCRNVSVYFETDIHVFFLFSYLQHRQIKPRESQETKDLTGVHECFISAFYLFYVYRPAGTLS